MTDVDTNAVREYLVSEHADVVETVRVCAESSATTHTRDGRTDTSAVRRGTEGLLREAGVWRRLPAVLTVCVDRAGQRLGATPVAAPPYVAPTATGIVLRGTTANGRLVVAVDALSVERGGNGTELRPREAPLRELVRVEWRG